VFLEVPSPQDIRAGIAMPPGSSINWLPRASSKPGALPLETVRQARLSGGPFYAWTAGESSMVTGIRRHLASERHVPKSDVSFRGYFSHGRVSL
jgi:NADPH-dependent ferric siderophore reductase